MPLRREPSAGEAVAIAPIDLSGWLATHLVRLLCAVSWSVGLVVLLVGAAAWHVASLPLLLCTLVGVGLGAIITLLELGELHAGMLHWVGRLARAARDGG